MSLEDFLSEKNNSSHWKDQKRKLGRIVIGLVVITIGLIGGATLLYFLKKDKFQNVKVLSASKKEEIQSVAALIRLQNEAKSLQAQIREMKTTPNERRPASHRKSRSINQDSDRSASVQIIDFDPGDGFSKLVAADENPYIPTGAVFRARLITPIKTSVERTFVLAETTHEYRMDMKRKIPKGSRLIGRSRLNPVLKGVIVEFDTLVLPNGIETSISGLALSHNALPEIDGLYFSDDLQNYGTALAFGFLSGFADAARKRQPTIYGYQPEESVSNQVLSGLSTASFQVAESILQDIRSRAIEYVVVPAGEPVFVALTRRYNLNQRSSK
jgi:hypothetical protein